ncbi:DUF1656 domain-containing protein [Zoogloea sp. LCSB751]|uniref:DUF1656 domain-containing protein n=1 Tax=unclassified Zoogloea TaxID=2640915 RepID=UPI0009A4CE06|nr:DUF1656 domain-containing protein [Zoogloea sp. LCSB751]
MIGELNLDGVLVSSILVSTPLAFVFSFLLRRVFSLVGLYRIVWHPALFDAAVFMIVWSLVIRLPMPSF